ncbi:ABC transporter ATP-binding protein [Actinoallomurus sp. NPDC052308]|uniref:ABC transporter ATP-binding protein n=1 Tax=Actinoallomurus sp. NPDC052308 TaxID=3155530 RepID=UPI00343E95C9
MRRGSTTRTENEQAGSERRGNDDQARAEQDGSGRDRDEQGGGRRTGQVQDDAREAGAGEGAVVGEMAALPWQAHLGELAATSLAGMSRRLPPLVGAAIRLAWRASRFDTTATVVLNLAAGVFTAYGLLATSGVLTALFAGGATPDRVRAALPSLALVAGAAALRSGLQAGAGWAQARLKPKVNRMVETRLFDLTMRVDLTAFDDTDFHDAMHRARQRGLYEASAVVQEAIDILTGLVGLAAAAGALGVLHPVLLPLLLLTAVPDGWAAARSARMRYLTIFTLSPVRRRKWVLADLMADRDSAAEIRAFTMRGFLGREHDRLGAEECAVHVGLARRQTVVQVLGEIAGGLATGAVYVVLGVLLATGALPLAVAGTAVLAIRSGKASLASLLYAVNQCYESGLYFADYLDFCAEAERRIPERRTGPVPATFDAISTEDVWFTYPGAEEPSLRGVSVRIRAGQVVALVGENGSGKTTLAKILAGLYRPDAGEVRWDADRLSEVDLERLRENVSVIPQDYTHWPMTARHNIAMGRTPDDAMIADAARASGADEVIEPLSQGYGTLLDRRFKDGHELSGGQWQRIAVARGFYRDAPLLICDEPTAALDARAEHALFERIRGHADGRTVLLITHRLASVRHADQVYVLDHGRVVEEGPPAALLAAGGVFGELYDLQAQAYRLDADQPRGPDPSR